jgi:formate dehydrogenase iron-sulfur subunit
VFGELSELHEQAAARVDALHAAGRTDAYLYGVDQPGTDGLHAFFLLTDEPEVYNLPSSPVAPSKTVGRAWRSMAAAGVAMAIAAIASARTGSSLRR